MNVEDNEEIVDDEFDEIDETKYFGFQTTRIVEAKDPGDREKFLKMALIELVIHTFFLITIIYTADNSNYKLVFDMTHSVTNLFVYSPISKNRKVLTFANISTMEHIWEYFRSGLMNGLYWELEYGGRNLTDEELGYILYRHRLLYFAQLRQIRGKETDCKNKKMEATCYDPYSASNVLKISLKGFHGVQFNKSNNLGFGKFIGRVSTYGPEGYHVELPKTKRDAIEMIDKLEESNWIDRSTRAVFIEFVLYNADLDNYGFVVLGIEMPVTGGIFTSYDVKVTRILRFQKNSEILDMIIEFLFNCFILYYLFVIVIEMLAFGCSYFTSFSSFSDMAIVGISLSRLGITLYGVIATRNMVEEKDYPSEMVISLGYIHYFADVIMSIVFCLAFIKLFKYLNFNSTLWSLSKTIYLCSKELSGLFVLCSVIYLAFCFSGVVLFGYEFEEFSNILYSLAALVRVLLGDMDFHPFHGRFNFAAIMFSLFFETIIFFVFMAGFLAIILNAYSQVSLLHQKQKFEMQMLEYTYRKLAQLFRKKYNEPPLISVKEWIKTMMDLGHPADAAQIIINKYRSQGITNNSFLTYPQQDELTYELEYYLKSSYVTEKLKMLYFGFTKMNNLFKLKSDPFVTPDSLVRGPTVASRMIHDIAKLKGQSKEEKDIIYDQIKKQLKPGVNLLSINKPEK